MNDTVRQRVINEYIQKDPFAVYLGAKIEIVKPGHSRVSLRARQKITSHFRR
ncbi:MAG: hypothetical protein U9R02_05820 [Thermodesulfobacteriota bacterium]|nr:hypothetical protein [Thermodesulfobacteriota bacterium]